MTDAIYQITQEVTGSSDSKRRTRIIRLYFKIASDELIVQEILSRILRKQLEDNPELDAVLVFGYSSREAELHQSFDRGRASLSRDGLGWLGDGLVIASRVRDCLGAVAFQLNVNSHITFYGPNGEAWIDEPPVRMTRKMWKILTDRIATKTERFSQTKMEDKGGPTS